ncbi:hypothetical protein ONZ51_g9611 [Trametes cubensis]|uniref:Uncharacterized protein n=1 Tax=Trametes cubensis TaxID=1111947 RepID=A0AAD7TL25_9APHY|nr:hypothetical protein ONZ51_g9611 [Trametes cubensis]
MEQWQENKRHGPSGPESAGPDGRIARTHPDEMDRRLLTPVDDPPIDRRDDRFRTDEPSSARRTGRSPPRDIDPDRLNRPLPTGPGGRRSRFDPPPPPVPDRMEVDASPAPRMPPAPRSATGGMHADRMQPEPPRGPRAMAPRDYSSVSSGTPGFQQPPSPYGSRNSSAPVADTPLAGPGRGRGRPIQSVDDRRWEPNDSGRRPSVSGPPHADNQMAPARRFDDGLAMPRDYPERPIGRAPLNDRRDDRAPPRMSGENVTGPRTSDYPAEHPASNATRSPVDRLRPANNDYGDRRPLPSESDPYDRRRPPFPPPDLLTPGSARNDRAGRRLSVGQDGPARPRMPDPVADRPVNQLPMRPREPPRDGAPPRQSRPGPPGPSPIAPPDSQPRIWQTRDEAQSARAQDPHSEDYVARERNGWEPEPPRRRWQAGSNEFDRREARTRSPEMPLRIRPSTPPPPVGNVHRYDEPLVEHPVAGKVHPERARLLAGEVPPPSEEFSRHSRGRRHGRSPNRAFDHGRPFEPDRGLPPRPADATRFGPPREQSPPPMQNGHRPPIGRGGSLLERLTLDDAVPPNEGGSSLRDRVDVGHGDEGGSSHADVMDVDGDGNGDDAHKGGRGPGRRRTGKPRRGRRNGVA